MAGGARVQNLERFKARVLGRYSKAAKDKIKAATAKNAKEFHDRVAAIVPVSEKAPHLKDSLEVREVGDLGVEVSIGGKPGAEHPAHLEHGHRARNGEHVKAKPFWFPAKRVMKKRAHNRNARALREAAKDAAGSGS